ncbi:MAG: nucleoside transporter C-terminal domain-containing protein [Flavobacteriales bacterium]|nr:nucleoside transporter C-terminal domain-containing protein [Flavobacteriales bacterium]
MKTLKHILLFVLLAGLFSSCSKKTPAELSLEEKLSGKWTLHINQYADGNYVPFDSAEYFIDFDTKTESFNSNIIEGLQDTTNGSWVLKSEDSLLTFTPFVSRSKIRIDSTVVFLDSNKRKVVYFSGGQQILKDENGSLEQKFANQTMSIDYLDGDTLIMGTVGMTSCLIRDNSALPKMEPYSYLSILRGILGMAFLLTIAWLCSSNRKAVNWSLVGKGVALQLIIAFLVLQVPFIETGFDYISKAFVWVIAKTDIGTDFLFGQLGIGKVQAPLLTFAIKVLPTIIFFSALVSLFYYWGIVQKIVYAFAWIMKKFMRLSGAESLAAAGNVFLGQTEAPLLVKPYLMGMTKSEIMCLMTGGMATIAGGVLAAYVNFLGGNDPVEQAFFAKHLLTASIISAPAAIIAAKILVPETEKINEDLTVSKEKIGSNALEAISNGTTDGLKLAVNVGAMLLVFIALMALGNGVLGWIGNISGLNSTIAENTAYGALSFEFILGYACRPVVWMIGIEWADSIYVGELLGTKTVLNEFVAYPRLGEMKDGGMISQKSVIMSTYMLCGFANFASIGIQIGGIGALAPTRKGLLSRLGVRALIGGTVACLLTAVIVGMTL